jgi:hypothetical protein
MLQTIIINEAQENDGKDGWNTACQSNRYNCNYERQCEHDTSTKMIRESTVNAYNVMCHCVSKDSIVLETDLQSLSQIDSGVSPVTQYHGTGSAQITQFPEVLSRVTSVSGQDNVSISTHVGIKRSTRGWNRYLSGK